VNVRGEGGVPKLPVRAATLRLDGIEGDYNRFRTERRNGDPKRAICIFSLERIHDLQREGHPIEIGTTGENLTIEGLDWRALEVGMKFKVGEATIELSGPCAPCNVIRESFKEHKFSRIDHSLEMGWSRWLASIISGGVVSAGDSVNAIDF
jgi:MOSC domain-containing protein YiiM